MEQEPVSETIGTTTNGAISSAVSKEYMGKIQYKVEYDFQVKSWELQSSNAQNFQQWTLEDSLIHSLKYI